MMAMRPPTSPTTVMGGFSLGINTANTNIKAILKRTERETMTRFMSEKSFFKHNKLLLECWNKTSISSYMSVCYSAI